MHFFTKPLVLSIIRMRRGDGQRSSNHDDKTSRYTDKPNTRGKTDVYQWLLQKVASYNINFEIKSFEQTVLLLNTIMNLPVNFLIT